VRLRSWFAASKRTSSFA